MKLIIFIALASSAPLHARAQALDSLWKIQLDEVLISYSVPLQTGDLVDFYKAGSFSSIDEVNARLPGVSLISRGAYALEPQMNGFSAGQLNINIDGMKIFGACTDKMDPVTSYVETDMLESIVLQHGTQGIESGSTIGGGLDLKLTEARPVSSEVFQTSISGGYESAAMGSNLRLISNVGREKLAVRALAVYRSYDSYTDGNGNRVPYTQFSKLNLSTNMSYHIDEKRSFKADVIYDRAVDIGYPALPMDVALARALITGIEYRQAKPGRLISKLTAKAYFNTIYHLMDDSQRDSLYLLSNRHSGKTDSVYMRMDMPGWSQTGGAWVKGESRMGKHFLQFKAENYFNSSRAEMTMFMNNLSKPGEPSMYAETWPETFRSVSGLYLADQISLSKKTQLKVNARFDLAYTHMLSDYGAQELSVFGYQADRAIWHLLKNGNLGWYYQTTPSLKAELSMGYGERLPSLSEQFGYYLYNANDGYDYVGNPGLKTERSLQLKQSLHFSKKKFKFSWSNQFSRIYDFIYGESSSTIPPMNLYASGLKIYKNLPSAFLYSTSAQVFLALSPNIDLFSVVNYTLGMKQKVPLPLIPPLNNFMAINYQRGKLTLQLENYTAAAQNRIDRLYGEDTTPSFIVFNFRLSHHIEWQPFRIDWSVGISNVFNAVYSEHLDWGNYMRRGRSVNFNLGFRF